MVASISNYRFWRRIVSLNLIILLLLTPVAETLAQSGRRPAQRPASPQSPASQTGPSRTGPATPAQSESAPPADPAKPLADNTPVEVGDDGTIRLDTSLVTIPVSVSDRNGRFIPDLRKSDFRLYEDGIEQQVDGFQSVAVPFNVIMLLDTSGSIASRLREIQEAAATFVDQLRDDDQVMVVSFAGRYRVECALTSDRARLREAIYGIRNGGGTRLYRAVDFVVDELQKIDGRKAVVLFTDGIDNSNSEAAAALSVARVEESGAIFYPIRYNPDLDPGPLGGGRGRRPSSGQPPIFSPGWPGWPMPAPRSGGRRRWPLRQEFGIAQLTAPQWPGGQFPNRLPSTIPGNDAQRGTEYLQELADSSGGRLYFGDSMGSISNAFGQIADELRHQYSLSYYPENGKKKGAFRTIQVRVSRPDSVVRARKGYRTGESPASN